MTGNESQQIGALTADVANIKTQLEKQDQKITEMRDIIVASKGSWRALVIVGGLLMALSSLLTSFVVKFWPGH